MPTLLRIDSSLRLQDSYTRSLTAYYEGVWKRINPGGKVLHRCLVSEPVPHLSQQVLESFDSASNLSSLSNELVSELKEADHILIGSPLYNLGLPSVLKAYWDHVVRSGVTFDIQEGQYKGLLRDKEATLVTARAGISSPDFCDDYQTAYLKSVLAFVGIERVGVVPLEATGLEQSVVERAMSNAKQHIDRILRAKTPPVWEGGFSEEDKLEIECLRDSQADAIVAGDAKRYAELCTDDVQLLVPGYDLVCGREQFFQTEEKLFSSVKFRNFDKYPMRVELSGDLAIETGRQEVSVQDGLDKKGLLAAAQKYTHVYRNTDAGWRISILMSNAIG